MNIKKSCKIIDLAEARKVRERELPGLYLGHRDEKPQSQRLLRPIEKRVLYDLPLIGPNRLPPEYLAA